MMTAAARRKSFNVSIRLNRSLQPRKPWRLSNSKNRRKCSRSLWIFTMTRVWATKWTIIWISLRRKSVMIAVVTRTKPIGRLLKCALTHERWSSSRNGKIISALTRCMAVYLLVKKLMFTWRKERAILKLWSLTQKVLLTMNTLWKSSRRVFWCLRIVSAMLQVNTDSGMATAKATQERWSSCGLRRKFVTWRESRSAKLSSAQCLEFSRIMSSWWILLAKMQSQRRVWKTQASPTGIKLMSRRFSRSDTCFRTLNWSTQIYQSTTCSGSKTHCMWLTCHRLLSSTIQWLWTS